ncbi:protein-(glutamine-N5) methyltransferase, release factor-specific [Mycoplasmopsis bovigenitalium]|uniref:peptide chain release factor N(5)-glutamine methyltransferase n=1 Tax=Mycoplasmopsis bovigenitalium TaxID=2112 RepID=UPI00090B637C|nr:peptide chain release factor N(5)-glutamine methyltransferase [Mycoplasmopsis bovigenitalium]BAW18393.1 protein-(glutamine-N5) methyltransferase, release factor-specific [Mycoplasmopsis bovigenitalium]
MPTIENLLQEKRRYGLELSVNEQEKKLLKSGMPIQYIMGFIEFSNTKILLNKNVLIPRYETEELVWIILNKFIQNNSNFSVLDLCCGSGFIGLSIKKNANNIKLTMADIDTNAIEQTKENLKVNNIDANDVEIVQSDLFTNVKGKFDLIICNPPYLDKDVLLENNKQLLFEPQHALYAPEKGFYFYRKILKEYKKYLKDNGKLIFEINPLHEDIWKNIEGVSMIKDINNKYRFVIV